MVKKRTHRATKPLNRLAVLTAAIIFLTGVIIVRLFYLQVIRYDYYEKVAAKEHYGYSELPARRGEIFIKDYASGELVRVATNTTLDLLFADPTLIENKKVVSDRIAPVIFNLKEARDEDEKRVKIELAKAKTPEEKAGVKSLTDEELFQKFSNDLFEKISQEKRAQILLSNELTKEILDQIAGMRLPGIEINETELIAYPAQIVDRHGVAVALSPFLELPSSELESILKGLNRYVILKRKLPQEVSAQIKKIIKEDKTKSFNGLGLKEEYYRYYPEGQLASNILGFVTGQGIGQYGIESKYNAQLQGKKGVFQTQKDSIGRQITVGDNNVIQPAVDGDDVVLTIDRSIQMNVENMLAKYVKEFRADDGQLIVMDPKTGRIIAMANYPTFDPNDYGNIYDKEPVNLSADDVKNLVPVTGMDNTFWFYRDVIKDDKYMVFREQQEDGTVIYKKYKNMTGPEAYQNKAVSQSYEPGSVYKIITMAAAIDDGDVKPSTSFNDPGYIYLDKNKNGKHVGPDGERYDAKIKNVSEKCVGYVNMTWVIQNSCNTGMTYVARKMGRSLFYSYMLKFGFNERTEIEFDNESAGKIAHFEEWTDSELANHAFGQGILVTPIQMASAYSAIANKGVLMQPHIVDSIVQKDGKTVKTEPSAIQRVVSEQTANTMTAMLVNNVENGDSYGKIRLKDHYLGAKTGTAQTYKHGEAMSGVGTTVVTVVGFAPIDDPKFVILSKMSRPRTVEWADSTAAVLYHDVAEYLFTYYSIPPDKK